MACAQGPAFLPANVPGRGCRASCRRATPSMRTAASSSPESFPGVTGGIVVARVDGSSPYPKTIEITCPFGQNHRLPFRCPNGQGTGEEEKVWSLFPWPGACDLTRRAAQRAPLEQEHAANMPVAEAEKPAVPPRTRQAPVRGGEVRPRLLPREGNYVEDGKSRASFPRRAEHSGLRPRGKGPVSREATACEFTAPAP